MLTIMRRIKKLVVISFGLIVFTILSCSEGVDLDSVRKAAEQGDANAQSRLGYMYFEGKGVEQNYAEAVKWFRKAAEQGEVYAQNGLGNMYFEGKGTEQSYTEAVKWYRKAAKQGDAYAQNGLAYMYANGLGIERNYTEAVKWCRKAVEQGHADAQKNLDIYAEGEAENIAKTEHVQNRKSEPIKDGFKNFAWGTNFKKINSAYPLKYVGVNKGLRQVKQYECGIKSLGGAQIDVFIFEFYKDKFFGIWVQVKNCHDSQKLRKALEKVYGKPDDGGLDYPMFEMNSWNSSKTSRIFSYDISKCIGNLFMISLEVGQELQKDEKKDLEIAGREF